MSDDTTVDLALPAKALFDDYRYGQRCRTRPEPLFDTPTLPARWRTCWSALPNRERQILAETGAMRENFAVLTSIARRTEGRAIYFQRVLPTGVREREAGP